MINYLALKKYSSIYLNTIMNLHKHVGHTFRMWVYMTASFFKYPVSFSVTGISRNVVRYSFATWTITLFTLFDLEHNLLHYDFHLVWFRISHCSFCSVWTGTLFTLFELERHLHPASLGKSYFSPCLAGRDHHLHLLWLG